MKKYNLITPEGTKDFLFEECLVKRETEDKIHKIFQGKGYCELTTPGLEFFDVFQSKSSYYPQESLYKMTDSKNRLLVLRSESTIPIARVAATRLRDAQLPLRLYYNQSAYRFETALKGRSDEIVQSGIELLGSASYMADLEMITTAIEVLDACSETGFSLEIGDAGVFKELMSELNASPEQAEEIRYLIETKNYPALNDLLDEMGDSDVIRSLKKLPSLFGGEEVFEKASKIYVNQRIDEILCDLKHIYEDLSKLIGNGKITVDLGMVNKADYYTGVIIKGYLAGYGEEVLSGGRYNKLLSDFGYDIPAVGFAVNIDAVSKVAMKNNSFKIKPAENIVFAKFGYEKEAILFAKSMREQGHMTELALQNTIEEVKQYAESKQISHIFVVDKEITEVQ